MSEVGVEAALNRWDEPLALGVVDPHDSLSHPAGVSDVQTETATCLDPDQFTNFLVGLQFFLGEMLWGQYFYLMFHAIAGILLFCSSIT